MDNLKTQLRGRWRITETSAWDLDYLDLVEPAYIVFDDPREGSAFAFGVVTASLDCAYCQTDVGFDWRSSDEGMAISGSGWAEPDGPDAIHGKITFESGDETTFQARRWIADRDGRS